MPSNIDTRDPECYDDEWGKEEQLDDEDYYFEVED
jgi:hypothetical protein